MYLFLNFTNCHGSAYLCVYQQKLFLRVNCSLIFWKSNLIKKNHFINSKRFVDCQKIVAIWVKGSNWSDLIWVILQINLQSVHTWIFRLKDRHVLLTQSHGVNTFIHAPKYQLRIFFSTFPCLFFQHMKLAIAGLEERM